jgi:hypothetical protein
MNWPETITKTYPLPPFVKEEEELGRSISRHPTRPWWVWFCLDVNARLFGETERSDPRSARYGWLRRDLQYIHVETIQNALTAALFNKTAQDKFDPHGFELVEAIDAAKPLPHPGYRLGQIWASASGESVQVERLNDGHPIVRTWVFHGGELRGGMIGTSHLEDVDLPKEYAYLVHDPACPWFAPWVATSP